jgi:hypothetical protein
MTYDEAGNILTKTQPLTLMTTYENYDFRGNPGKRCGLGSSLQSSLNDITC